jgi:hypothetical protein
MGHAFALMTGRASSPHYQMNLTLGIHLCLCQVLAISSLPLVNLRSVVSIPERTHPGLHITMVKASRVGLQHCVGKVNAPRKRLAVRCCAQIEVDMLVKGMTCGHCTSAVEKVLKVYNLTLNCFQWKLHQSPSGAYAPDLVRRCAGTARLSVERTCSKAHP